MRRRRFAIAGRSASAWARVKDHSPHRYELRCWPNLPTHERFAKIVLWYRRYDPVAFALRLKAMQYRPRDGGVCRGDMANRSSIQRASSSGVRAGIVVRSNRCGCLQTADERHRGRNRRPAGATALFRLARPQSLYKAGRTNTIIPDRFAQLPSQSPPSIAVFGAASIDMRYSRHQGLVSGRARPASQSRILSGT